jgi:hypothetical protein
MSYSGHMPPIGLIRWAWAVGFEFVIHSVC